MSCPANTPSAERISLQRNELGSLLGLVAPDRNQHGGATVGGCIRFAGHRFFFFRPNREL